MKIHKIYAVKYELMVWNKTLWISLTKEYGKYLNTERQKKMAERRTNHEQLADFKVKQQTEGNRGNIPV